MKMSASRNNPGGLKQSHTQQDARSNQQLLEAQQRLMLG